MISPEQAAAADPGSFHAISTFARPAEERTKEHSLSKLVLLYYNILNRNPGGAPTETRGTGHTGLDHATLDDAGLDDAGLDDAGLGEGRLYLNAKGLTGMAKRITDLPAAMQRGHDHDRCIEEALSAAVELCARRGVRLTKLRRRVLELVWHSHAPLGAYTLLDMLRADGRKAMPPTVYRALEFLLEQKLIHRIASLNAFVGCVNPREPHSGQHLICRRCGIVAEMDDAGIAGAIAASARELRFSVARQLVEVTGLCVNCAAPGSEAAHVH